MKLDAEEKWKIVKAYYEKVSKVKFKKKLSEAQVDELYMKMKQFERSVVDHFQREPILAEKSDHYNPAEIFKGRFSISRKD